MQSVENKTVSLPRDLFLSAPSSSCLFRCAPFSLFLAGSRPSAVATRVHYTRDAPREGREKGRTGSYLICFPFGPLLRSIDIALIHFHSVLALVGGRETIETRRTQRQSEGRKNTKVLSKNGGRREENQSGVRGMRTAQREHLYEFLLIRGSSYRRH